MARGTCLYVTATQTPPDWVRTVIGGVKALGLECKRYQYLEDLGARSFWSHYSISIGIGTSVPQELSDQTVDSISAKWIDDPNIFVESLKTIIQRRFRSPRASSVVVWDYDDTLVNEKGQILFKEIPGLVHTVSKYFDYSVLWTHATTKWLIQNSFPFKFDVIMTRGNEPTDGRGAKHSAHVLRALNDSLGVVALTYSALIDDTKDNFDFDYDTFVQPPRGGLKAGVFWCSRRSVIIDAFRTRKKKVIR